MKADLTVISALCRIIEQAAEMVRNAVIKGKLTEDEYREIVGEA